MFIPDPKMDVNKFVVVHVPSKSSYLQKLGFATAPANLFTGDVFAPLPKDKVGSIADMEAYDRMMQEQEISKTDE